MKTLFKFVLLLIVTAAAATGFAAVFVPGGVQAVFQKVVAKLESPPAAAPTPSTTQPPAEEPTKPAGADELRDAERAYDSGEFASAIDHFAVARVDADSEYRDRAARGLTKAVLAWALTFHAAAPASMPDDPDAEVARRQSEAEAVPSERAWYDLTLFAAGCGLKRKLPYLTQQAIASGVQGGPVEKRLKGVLEAGVPRGALLREAMLAQGFIQPQDPVGETAAAPPAAKPAAPPPVWRTQTSVYVPTGKFKAATKERLARAIDFEKRGTAEYELCGPDNKQRKEHRKASIDLLKQAREIYLDAEEEDPDSADLAKRLQVVLEMISHLHKEMSLGE